jgi:hypothetical protein
VAPPKKKSKKPAKAPAPKAGKPSKEATAPADEAEVGGATLDSVLKEMTDVVEKKKSLDQWVSAECPYCSESFEVHITHEEDGATMYEDCAACSRSVQLHVHIEDDDVEVSAYRS